MEKFQSLIQTVYATFLIFIQTPWDTSSCYSWFATSLRGRYYTLLVTNNCNLFIFLFPQMKFQRWTDSYTFQSWLRKLVWKFHCDAPPTVVIFVWPCVCFVLVFLICFLHVLPFQLLVVCDQLRALMSWRVYSLGDFMCWSHLNSLCDVNHVCCFNGLGLPYSLPH